MGNINLSSTGAEEKSAIEVGRGGLVMIFSVLVLVVLLYGAELLYGSQLTKEISQVQSEYASNFGDLSKGNFFTVVDFQNRLNIAKTEISEGKNVRENMAEIEKAVIPGVYLTSYTYNDKDKSILLECMGDNYNLAAKQILNFKKSDWFSEASGGETTLNSELGKVAFKVNLKLK